MGTRSDAATAAAAEVRRRGGLVRGAELTRAGTPRGAVADAVAAGLLSRVRRVWLAEPTADPELMAAARHGVVLSCVTQARRLGLWVLDERRPHVAAHPHAGAVAVPGASVHRARPLVPRHPHALVDPVENVLALVAACQPFEAALVVWESALRKGLVDLPALRRLPLSTAARAVCARATVYSDSVLETLVLSRTRWLGVCVVPQAWILGHRVDFLFGERLVLQVDGGHHVDEQRASDNAHDAALMLHGYHVIRVGYAEVVGDWPRVQDLLMRAIAQGLHRA